LKREWIVQGQVLHLDGHDIEASIQAARWAHETGMKVSLDIDKLQPGVEELLRYTDFAIPSQDFVVELSADRNWRSGLRELGRLTKGFVAATRGKDGVAVLYDGDLIEIPGFTGKAIDTTGAGDVFHGAFIYSLFQNWTVLQCVHFANAAALEACGRYGARAGIPELEQVRSFLEKAPGVFEHQPDFNSLGSYRNGLH
jgi:ribokinase